MKETILQTLFLDNPEIPVEVADFCNSIPAYTQAEQEYNRAVQELIKLIGIERYSRFEDILNWHLFLENRAYYLFGLGLRREILEGMAN